MKLALHSTPDFPPVPGFTQAPDSSIDLRGLMHIFLSRLWLLVLSVIVCVAAGGAYLYKTPKMYASSAVLEAKAPIQNLNVIDKENSPEVNALEEQHTFEQSLTNRTLLIAVARTLHLDHDSRLFPKRTVDQEATDAEVARAIAPHVQAELRRGTRLVDLSVTYFDPDTAKQIADKVIELYVTQGLNMESGATHRATDSLAMEAERLRAKMEEADKALQAFKEKNTGLPADAGYNLNLERTKELNTQYSKAKGQRLQLEADMVRLDQIKGGSVEDLLSIGSIASQPDLLELNKTINDKQREFLVLKEWSGPRHPRYVQAQKELDYLIAARNDTLKHAASKMRSAFDNAQQEETKLQSAIAEQEHISNEQGRQNLPLEQLENELKTDRDLYEMVTKRLKETTLASTLAVANFRVTESPIVVPDAVSPRKVQILGLALAAGLILGLGAAFGLEILKPVSPMTTVVPASLPELPILAELPSTATDPLTLAFDCARHRHTPECAAFRTLRSSLSFLRHDQESRSIAITSATEDGETSFCALNLAATYAGENLKTLLIVADYENFELERVLIDPARGPVRGLFDGVAK